MRQQSKESLVLLFVAGALVLNYPFLYLFDRAWLPFGIPLLYLYLYLVWFVIIALLIVIVQRSEIRSADPATPPPDHIHQPDPATPDPGGSDDANRRSRP